MPYKVVKVKGGSKVVSPNHPQVRILLARSHRQVVKKNGCRSRFRQWDALEEGELACNEMSHWEVLIASSPGNTSGVRSLIYPKEKVKRRGHGQRARWALRAVSRGIRSHLSPRETKLFAVSPRGLGLVLAKSPSRVAPRTPSGTLGASLESRHHPGTRAMRGHFDGQR